MANIQTGTSTAGLANVNSDFELLVAPTKVKDNSGYITPLIENDDGTLFGSKKLDTLRTTENHRLRVGQDTEIFDYIFNSTTQDFAVWKNAVSTFATVFSTTGAQLNSGLSGTTGQGTCLSTYRHFTASKESGLVVKLELNITNELLANQEYTFGWFPTTTGVTAPAEGIYYKLTTAGLFGYTNFNNSESNATGQLATALTFTPNTTYNFFLRIYQDKVCFLLDGKLLPGGELSYPLGGATASAQQSFPISIQSRNTGTVTGTIGALKVLYVSALQQDVNTGLDLATNYALRGLSGYQGIKGGTQGSTALLTNNLAAGAGVALTNTTAAAGSGLGGQFAILPTLAAGTDGILCSYQVPVGSTNLTPRTLVIYGVRIQGAVTTTLAGNTGAGTFYLHSLAYGHTAVSMATIDAVAAKAPRRVPLGYDNYAAVAAAGTIGTPVVMSFTSPIVVNPGEFVAICAKNLGVVTTSGVITFSVTFDSLWV